jgi:hypothetical protein
VNGDARRLGDDIVPVTLPGPGPSLRHGARVVVIGLVQEPWGGDDPFAHSLLRGLAVLQTEDG